MTPNELLEQLQEDLSRTGPDDPERAIILEFITQLTLAMSAPGIGSTTDWGDSFGKTEGQITIGRTS